MCRGRERRVSRAWGGGGLLPVIYGRGDVELSAFGSRLLTVSSPDCYAREGCKGKNHHSCVVAVT